MQDMESGPMGSMVYHKQGKGIHMHDPHCDKEEEHTDGIRDDVGLAGTEALIRIDKGIHMHDSHCDKEEEHTDGIRDDVGLAGIEALIWKISSSISRIRFYHIPGVPLLCVLAPLAQPPIRDLCMQRAAVIVSAGHQYMMD